MHPGDSYPSSPWLRRFEPAPAGSQFQLRTSRLPDPESPSELPVWCTGLTGRYWGLPLWHIHLSLCVVSRAYLAPLCLPVMRRCCWAGSASSRSEPTSGLCDRYWTRDRQRSARTAADPARAEDRTGLSAGWDTGQHCESHSHLGRVPEGWGLPKQLGGHSGSNWQGWNEWQTGGLNGRELSVIEGGKARGEGVPWP